MNQFQNTLSCSSCYYKLLYSSFFFVVVTNMALNKHATQSSTMYSGDASRAVDGDTNTVEALWDNGRFSCSHTDEGDLSAWWKVDLGKEVVVSQVNTVKSKHLTLFASLVEKIDHLSIALLKLFCNHPFSTPRLFITFLHALP